MSERMPTMNMPGYGQVVDAKYAAKEITYAQAERDQALREKDEAREEAVRYRTKFRDSHRVEGKLRAAIKLHREKCGHTKVWKSWEDLLNQHQKINRELWSSLSAIEGKE